MSFTNTVNGLNGSALAQSTPVARNLEAHGIHHAGAIHWNLSTPALYEEAVRRGEASVAHLGPLIVQTGKYTGRSPKDKFIVKTAGYDQFIHWGKVNQPMSEEGFRLLHQRVRAYVQGKELYIQDCYAGADAEYKMPIRIITEQAWHSLFARNMFIQAKPGEPTHHAPEFTVIDVPNCRAVPEMDGTNSEVFVVINFKERLVLIGGTHYGGEIKKAIFTIMNYLLPLQDVLPMHCSANRGDDDSVALFFGLSGTGKTTLSTDPARTLIGDDEHGWSSRGTFNFEGGCYAKTIRLSAAAEPDIYAATRRFGTILENVIMDVSTRRVDLDDDSLTENTRAVYPIAHIPNATRSGQGGHPNNVIMLTADAFGVLPPIARLTPAQAVYHFLSGYTAKVAGTERGVTAPEATFSSCFGEPFMVHHPTRYAEMLRQKIEEHNAAVWLINTGWSGGSYGKGARINIRYTRAMVNAALSGALAQTPVWTDPIFQLHVPVRCPSVPDEVLRPHLMWDDAAEYNVQAHKLAAMFAQNFAQYAHRVDAEIMAAGPKPEVAPRLR
ncbi:MAG: phosphoenolpyruvate carboxykinase (ATP) [Caldilineaceae bacterium]|nr:phosphoenolpyruvate carboxykinase (ATP) [Caldilineaceae bacterium]